MIEFVTASHDPVVLAANLQRSKIYRLCRYSFSVTNEGNNVPKSYNSIGPITDYMCYLHHDLFLPDTFEESLINGITLMNVRDPKWGVLGVAGVKLITNMRENFGYILDRGKPWFFNTEKLPIEVDTLDDMLLITQSDFVFDENLPLDFYGPDVCMQARAQGRKCYVIDAYVEHNSSRPFKGEGLRTTSYYKSREYFRNKWKQYLPICTTTGIIQ